MSSGNEPASSRRQRNRRCLPYNVSSVLAEVFADEPDFQSEYRALLVNGWRESRSKYNRSLKKPSTAGPAIIYETRASVPLATQAQGSGTVKQYPGRNYRDDASTTIRNLLPLPDKEKKQTQVDPLNDVMSMYGDTSLMKELGKHLGGNKK